MCVEVNVPKRDNWSIVRWVMAGMFGLVVLIALAIAWLGPLLSADDYVWEKEFDSAVWKSTPVGSERHSVRQSMVHDFLDNYKVIGMKRAEVEGLIGPPKVTPYFHEYDMVYFLGQERGVFAIDSEWLIIKLDAAGKVTEARLATD